MKVERSSLISLPLAAMLAATTAGPTLAQPGGGEKGPLTLTMAVADVPGRQSEPAVIDLVSTIAELSDGDLTIVPVFGAGDATEQGFELGVAELLKAGAFDLAMTSTRAWDLAGVSSLQAFQAPFLIDNDALALAVAQSDIADRALAGMGHGVTGLAIWPEDLRHLFWFPASGSDLGDVAAVEGAAVLVIPSAASRALVTALGGQLYEEGIAQGPFTGDKDADAQAGTLAAFETGLVGAGLPFTSAVVAGDLVLFPKYQALIANDGALGRLSPDQRRVLDEAVDRVQRAAFGRQFAEVDLAKALCAEGVTVVRIGTGAVAGFVEAARSVYEDLTTDALTAALIADIEALKAIAEPSPAAEACDALSAEGVAYPVSDATGTLGTEPPSGVFRAMVTVDEMVARGADPGWARENAGLMTWTFAGGTVTQEVMGRLPCKGAYESVGARYVSMWTKPGQPCGLELTFRWRDEPEGISFVLMPPVDSEWPLQDFLDIQAHLEGRTWTRIGEPAPAGDGGGDLPPDGTYRAVITIDDLVAKGVGPQDARAMAGTVAWILRGGESTLRWEAPGRENECDPTYGQAGTLVRLVFHGTDGLRDPLSTRYLDGCEPGEVDLEFAVREDRLYPTVVRTTPASDLSLTKAFFERWWSRIE